MSNQSIFGAQFFCACGRMVRIRMHRFFGHTSVRTLFSDMSGWRRGIRDIGPSWKAYEVQKVGLRHERRTHMRTQTPAGVTTCLGGRGRNRQRTYRN